MSKPAIWLMYAGITAVSAIIFYATHGKKNMGLKVISAITAVIFSMAGIVLVLVTLIFAQEYFAPHLWDGWSGSDSGQEECVPDPWGGC